MYIQSIIEVTWCEILRITFCMIDFWSAPFKSAVKNMVKKEKIVVGLIASSKSKKNGKLEKGGREGDVFNFLLLLVKIQIAIAPLTLFYT